jgi:hypothetical protein
MAVERKRPSDVSTETELNTSTSAAGPAAPLPSLSSFDSTLEMDRTALDLDAFAPYKPSEIVDTDHFKAVKTSGGNSMEEESNLPTSINDPDPEEDLADFSTYTDDGFGAGLKGLHASPQAAPAEFENMPMFDDESLILGGSPQNRDFDLSEVPNWSVTDTVQTDVADDSKVIQSSTVAKSRLFVQFGKFSAMYELDDDEFLIGRPDVAGSVTPDILIEWDDAISRKHAHVFRQSAQFYVEDLGSTNGTKVNGILLVPGSPQQLHDGDLINVGSKTSISFYE